MSFVGSSSIVFSSCAAAARATVSILASPTGAEPQNPRRDGNQQRDRQARLQRLLVDDRLTKVQALDALHRAPRHVQRIDAPA